MVVNAHRAGSPARTLTLVGSVIVVIAGLAMVLLMSSEPASSEIPLVRFEESIYAGPLLALLGLLAFGLAIREAPGVFVMFVALVTGAVAGVFSALAWMVRWSPSQPDLDIPAGVLALVGASCIGLGGIRKVAQERVEAGRDEVPGPVRGLAVLGALGMVAGPLLKWRVIIEPEQGDILFHERGITSYFGGGIVEDAPAWSPVFGWIVVALGIVTLILCVRSSWLRYAIVPGLIGGAITLSYLALYGVYLPIPHGAIDTVAGGLFVAIGGAALSGAAGVTAAAVAMATRRARRMPAS